MHTSTHFINYFNLVDLPCPLYLDTVAYVTLSPYFSPFFHPLPVPSLSCLLAYLTLFQ